MNHSEPLERCPKCNGALLHFRSMNKKCCSDCRTEFDWHLKENQRPLIQHQR
jgi:protein-arginine kinase activator protein McsA